MKLIFVFALIAAVSCDVSHIVQGDGWYKDETGYHYTQPAAKFDEVVVEEVVVADEPAPVELAEPEPVVYDAPVEVAAPVETPVETPVEEVVVADEPAPVEVADPVVVEVPVNNLREYLPPVVTADAKKKRQIPVRRVYRRFLKRY